MGAGPGVVQQRAVAVAGDATVVIQEVRGLAALASRLGQGLAVLTDYHRNDVLGAFTQQRGRSYAVIARYECAPADAEIIRAALLAMREHTHERYVDKSAFEAHKSSEHFVEHIVETVFPCLTGRTVMFAGEL